MKYSPLKMSVAVLAAASVSLGLAACGSGNGAKTTIYMVESQTSPSRTQILREQVALFEEANPDINVELVSPPTEQSETKIQQMLQSEKNIDVVEIRDVTVGTYSANGWLYDMSKEIENWDGRDNLTEAAQLNLVQKNGSFFVPSGFYGLSLFNRTDLLEEHGFAVAGPTWDDVLEQAEAIQDPTSNTYGWSFRGGASAADQFMAVLETYNIENLDTSNAFMLRNGQTMFSSEESRAAIDMYLKLFEKASPPSSISWGFAEMVQGFSSGSTGFLMQDPEVIAALDDSEAIAADQWTTAALPLGPSGMAARRLSVAGWGIAESSQNKEAAWKLVQFLVADEQSTAFAKGNSMVPIAKSASQDPFFSSGAWAAYVEMNDSPDKFVVVVEPRDVPWFTEWNQVADVDMQKLLSGEATPEETLKKWDQFWTDKQNAS